MTAPRPFGPSELDGAEGATPDDVVAESRIARDLEGLAAQGASPVPAGFVDGVMAAVDAEPLAAPAHAARTALRRGAIGAFLASFSDALRVIARPGFPALVRAQALALVVVVGAFAAGTGVAAAGAVGLIRDDGGRPSPAPTFEAPTHLAPSPAMPSPSMETPSPDPSTAPTSTASDTAPTIEPAGTRRPSATDDHGGGGSGGSGSGGSGGGAGGSGDDNGGQRTPRPTQTAGDDHSGPGGGGGGDDGGSSGGGSGSDDGSGSGSGGGDDGS